MPQSSATQRPPTGNASHGNLLKLKEHKMRMVADAVVIEPVSASQFPANREKNREFFDFVAPRANRRPTMPNDIRAFEPNSLNIGTGNF